MEHMENEESERMKEFGMWLRVILADRHIQGKQLAAALHVDANQVSRWINGQSGIRRETALKLASALELDRDEVLMRAGYADMPPREMIHPSLVEFGERVKAVLKRRSMTQHDCALLTGFSHAATRGHLSNGRDPGVVGAVRYAKALDVSVDYLLGIDTKVGAEPEGFVHEYDEKTMGRIVSLSGIDTGFPAPACRFRSLSVEEVDAFADRVAERIECRIYDRLHEEDLTLRH